MKIIKEITVSEMIDRVRSELNLRFTTEVGRSYCLLTRKIHIPILSDFFKRKPYVVIRWGEIECEEDGIDISKKIAICIEKNFKVDMDIKVFNKGEMF